MIVIDRVNKDNAQNQIKSIESTSKNGGVKCKNFEEMEDIALTEKVLQSSDSSRLVSRKAKMSQKFNSRKDS